MLRVVDITLVGLCFVSGIYGAEWVLMGVVLLWRSGLAVAWGVVFGKYAIVVDLDVRVVVVSRLRMVMIVDGGVC